MLSNRDDLLAPHSHIKENQHVEWKEVWRDEYLRWISAFANADGGMLHIGRDDRGVVIGVPHIGCPSWH